MEAAGLVVGVPALVGVVTSCIELTKTIQLGRNFADDLYNYELRLAFMQRRFNACCESVVQYYNTNGDCPIVETATKAFCQVQSLFIEAQKKSGAFRKGQNSDLSKTPTTSNKMSLTKKSLDFLHSVPKKHLDEMKKLQKQFKTKDKIFWAIYEKDTFNNLVEKIRSLIDELEKEFPASIITIQRQMTKLTIEEIPEKDMVELITKAAEKDDPVLHGFGRERLDGWDNMYVGNRQKGNSMGVNGDVYTAGWMGGRQESHNLYQGNVSEDNAKVINGNQYGGKGIFDD